MTTSTPARVHGRHAAPRAVSTPDPDDRRATGRGGRAVLTRVVAVVVVLGVVGAAVLWADHRRTARAQAAWVRTAAALEAEHSDVDVAAAAVAVVAARTRAAQHDDITTQATTALSAARHTAGNAPHAGDVMAPMAAAAGSVAGALTSRYSPVLLRGLVERLALAHDEVVDAEQQWQTAEDARTAAARAAAERARKSGARAAPAPPAPAPVLAAPAGASPQRASCGTSTGSPAVSSAELAHAINTWRATQGLPALATPPFDPLAEHAMAMAAAGAIWHSGADNMVGCASSATALVEAWAASPAHRAFLATTASDPVRVGAASDGAYVYGAFRLG
ncbi:MAG: hypothetical protein FWE61_10225 [Micrococcales bacterium]|nr:hypothetical protein [Micrococcales bacterium]